MTTHHNLGSVDAPGSSCSGIRTRSAKFKSTAFAYTLLGAALIGCSFNSIPIGPVLGPAQFYDVSPAWSPDGRWIAFHRGGPVGAPSGWGLFKIKTDGTQETKLLDSADSHGILTIDWSDQDWLLVSTFNATVYKVRPDGTNKTVLYGGPAQGATWSPDGSQIAFRPPSTIWIMDSAGQNVRLLDTADTVFQGERAMPDWGEGGQILHLRYVSSQAHPLVAQVDPQSLVLTVLDSGYAATVIAYPKYADTSSFVFIKYDDGRHPQLWRVDSAFAPARCLTCGDDLNEGGGEFDMLASSGEIVYANSRHGGLSIMDANGSNKRQLTSPGRPWP
jgi:Tol biopolymer transport system component